MREGHRVPSVDLIVHGILTLLIQPEVKGTLRTTRLVATRLLVVGWACVASFSTVALACTEEVGSGLAQQVRDAADALDRAEFNLDESYGILSGVLPGSSEFHFDPEARRRFLDESRALFNEMTDEMLLDGRFLDRMDDKVTSLDESTRSFLRLVLATRDIGIGRSHPDVLDRCYDAIIQVDNAVEHWWELREKLTESN